MKTIEERLKTARKYAGLSQKEFAQKLSINHRTIIRYEQDASKLSIQIAENISTITGVNFIWLISGEGSMISEPDHFAVQEVPAEYSVPDKNKDAIRNIIKNLMFIDGKKSSMVKKIETYVQGVADSLKQDDDDVDG